MSKSIKSKKQAHRPQQPAPPVKSSGGSGLRWVIIASVVLLTAGGTWAFMEFVVWNKLPSELVGTWEVVQGPPEYKEAEFEFYRSGKMVGRLNDNDTMHIMNANVEVDGDKMYVTTRQPSTGKEHVSVQTIRTLNSRELVVADERGKVMKMVRLH